MKEVIMKTFTVYKHIFPNGKVYIGITSKPTSKRWRGGLGYSSKSQVVAKAIKKYGWDNIEHEIVAENLTQEEATELEIYLIDKHNSTDIECGYNLLAGGYGRLQWTVSDKTREKLRKAMLGKKATEETKKKLSLAQRRTFAEGRRTIISSDTKLKISNTLKRLWETGEVSGMKGKSLSAESRAKISAKKLGKSVGKGVPKSAEHCDNISKAMKASWASGDRKPRGRGHTWGSHSEETKKLMRSVSPNKKRILQLDKNTHEIIKEWGSIIEASEALQIERANIGACCNGRLKTAGGFSWKFLIANKE